MSAATDLDPVLRYACKLLHSSHTDAAEKIRIALDEQIRQRHGAHRMLVNTLPKRYLADESLAPGSGIPQPPPLQQLHNNSRRPSSKSIDSRSSSLAMDSPRHNIITTITLDSGGEDDGSDLVISVPDDDDSLNNLISEKDRMLELENLMCQVCNRIDVTARNHLIECADCHSLYHQDCHIPVITDADAQEQEFPWCCSYCKNKLSAANEAVAVAAVSASIAPPLVLVHGHTSSSPAKSSSSHSSSSSSSGLHANTAAAASSSSSSSLSHKHTTKPPQISTTTFEAVLQLTTKPSATVAPTTPTTSAAVINPSMPSLGNNTHHHHHHRSGSGSGGDGHHHTHKSSKSSSSSSSSSSRHHHKSSSSHSAREREREREREERQAASASAAPIGGTSKPSITPNINIISADKRLQNMKKKAAKMQESRRKHK